MLSTIHASQVSGDMRTEGYQMGSAEDGRPLHGRLTILLQCSVPMLVPVQQKALLPRAVWHLNSARKVCSIKINMTK